MSFSKMYSLFTLFNPIKSCLILLKTSFYIVYASLDLMSRNSCSSASSMLLSVCLSGDLPILSSSFVWGTVCIVSEEYWKVLTLWRSKATDNYIKAVSLFCVFLDIYTILFTVIFRYMVADYFQEVIFKLWHFL